MRLLLVEDDPMIGQAVLDALRAEHYAVDWVRDGEMADTALRSADYDLMLLDLGLPRRDGLQVLRELRARRSTLPVLVATARDAVSDRVAGLDAGADDYVVKPFDTDELLALCAPCCGARPARPARCTSSMVSASIPPPTKPASMASRWPCRRANGRCWSR
jgi:two-component system OmpR family response regulator